MIDDRALGLTFVIVAMAFVGLFTLALWLAAPGHSRELYPGQYAQVDPAQRKWFQDQLVPGGPAKGSSCCNEADGATAEEEIRGDHYWVRFTYKKWDSATSTYEDADSDWMEVPDEVILDTNHNGAPIVWWWMAGGNKLLIRCYARGSGI